MKYNPMDNMIITKEIFRKRSQALVKFMVSNVGPAHIDN